MPHSTSSGSTTFSPPRSTLVSPITVVDTSSLTRAARITVAHGLAPLRLANVPSSPVSCHNVRSSALSARRS